MALKSSRMLYRPKLSYILTNDTIRTVTQGSTVAFRSGVRPKVSTKAAKEGVHVQVRSTPSFQY